MKMFMAKCLFYGISCLGLKGMMVKLLLHVQGCCHLRKKPETGDPKMNLWQSKIVFPTTLMETSPPSHPLKREAKELSGI